MQLRVGLSFLAGLALACGDDSSSVTGGDTGNGESSSGGGQGSTSGNGESSSGGGASSTTGDGGATTAVTETAGETTAAGTTAVGPMCGDGTLDEGEECDDHNTADGDTCRADCTLPVAQAWVVTYNGPASGQDVATDVQIDGMGNVYVLGRERVTDQGSNLWLSQYTSEGRLGWTYSFDGAGNLDDSGSAMALVPNGDFIDIVVVGQTESAMSGNDILIQRISGETHEAAWTQIVDGTGSGMNPDVDDDDGASDVVVNDEGTIFVTGRQRVDMQSYDVWVASYSADGMTANWSTTYNVEGVNGPDIGRGLALADDGPLWVVANIRDEGNLDHGVLLAYNAPDGAPFTDMNMNFDPLLRSLERDAAGNMLMVGTSSSDTTGDDVFMWAFGSDLSMLWTASFSGDGALDDFGAHGVFSATGAFVVGSEAVQGQSGNQWIGAYDGAGQAQWMATYNDDRTNLDESYNAVAVGPDGDPVAVGYETRLGEQTNIVIRKYHAVE